MKRPVHRANAPDKVRPDELIDDRALESRSEDLFYLASVADELVALCRGARTPATIALYGAWGSGKSSLGQIIGSDMADDSEVAFARFDALKYAETPLRRHFLSQLATSFEIKDDAFHAGLYKTTKKLHITTPSKRDMWRTLRTFALSFVLIALLVVVVGLIVAAFAPGSFLSSLKSTILASLTGVLLTSAVATTVMGQIVNDLKVETSTGAPSSEEQFEKLFKSLVNAILKKRSARRMVVFIDELDRCSPAQVASVMETLRTFLEVSGCIFVVAADQQVLERAATEAARQTAPLNTTNPYYSVGSSYLDKIFQFQFQLPPLLPRRLSRYSLALIENRAGVWEKVPSKPELVSVLIPTHVRSPRRVKALLNNFALHYRLALSRAESGNLDPDVATRASEVAKLVCLKTEFPLFAIDLQTYSRLPELVLLLSQDPKLTLDDLTVTNTEIGAPFYGLTDDVLARASAYARGELAVDQVLVEGNGSPHYLPAPREVSRQNSEPAPKAPSGEAIAGVESEDVAAAPSGSDSSAQQISERRAVQLAHARQLIGYLLRTKDVPGPKRDLIFLESAGAAFDLPSELAEQLETHALDANSKRVTDLISGITEESVACSAFAMLAHLVRESVGIEASNILSTVFVALGSTSHDVSAVVDDLLATATSYMAEYTLRPDDLAGAYRLSMKRDSATAHALRDEVIERPEAASDSRLALDIIRSTPQLPSAAEPRVQEIVRARLADERSVESLAEAFASLGVSHAERILDLAVGVEDEPVTLENTITLARSLREAGGLGLLLLQELLSLDWEDSDAAVCDLMADFAPIEDSRTVARALGRLVDLDDTGLWTAWLAHLDKQIARQSATTEQITAGVDRLLTRRLEEETIDDDVFGASAAALRLVAPEDYAVDASTVRAFVSTNTPPALTPEDLEDRARQLNALKALGDERLLAAETRSSLELAMLVGVISSAPVTDAVVAQAQTFVLDAAPPAIAQADDLQAFNTALASSSLLDAGQTLALQARCAAAAARRGDEHGEFGTDEAIQLKALALPYAVDALSEWITAAAPAPADILRLIDSDVQQGSVPSPAVTDALRAVTENWSADEKADYFDALAECHLFAGGRDGLLELGRPKDANEERVVVTLKRLLTLATDIARRRRLLDLWGAARPMSERSQRELADHVFVPLLGKGKETTRHALDHFDLVAAMKGAWRERIKAALRDAVGDDAKLQKRADQKMRDAGWMKTGKRWGVF